MKNPGPPLASEILARLRAPRVPIVQPKVFGASQRNPGPPPLASEILARFNMSQAPSVAQRKAGPPPLASEILGQFNMSPSPNTTQRVAQRKPGPPPLASEILARLRTSNTIQRFKLEEKNYNDIQKLGPLVTRITAAAPFNTKTEDVKYWLKQYVSIYPDDTFTYDELKDYLNDDIIRQGRNRDPAVAMTNQELLTTEAGFKRISSAKQAFPTTGDVKFYRTMEISELKAMLTAEGSDDEPDLPTAGTDIKYEILSPKKLGDHVGDYKQARSYFNGIGGGRKGQAMLEFVLPVAFFKPGNIALPEATSVFKTALTGKFGTGYSVATADQGMNAEIPGLKSEKRGLYSVGLSAPAAAVFIGKCSAVNVVLIQEQT